MTKTEVIPCSKEEMDKLIAATIQDTFFNMLFKTARTTGRRLGEYYDVRVKDVFDKPDGTKIMMTKVLKKRRKVEKEAILREDIYYQILQYIAQNKLNLEDYLFRKVSYRQIQNKIKVYAKKAGITHNVVFHNFRHYFITELVRKGWSYDKIAKLTGHTSVGTLTVYDHVIASDIKDDALEAIKDI